MRFYLVASELFPFRCFSGAHNIIFTFIFFFVCVCMLFLLPFTSLGWISVDCVDRTQASLIAKINRSRTHNGQEFKLGERGKWTVAFQHTLNMGIK